MLNIKFNIIKDVTNCCASLLIYFLTQTKRKISMWLIKKGEEVIN